MPITNTPAARTAQASSDSFTRDLFAWLNQVNGDATLPGSALKVALKISQHINRESGDAWPSTENIGKGIAMSKATVLEMVARLKANGHLAIEPGCQGRGHSNRYRLILKAQPADLLDTGKVQPADLSEHRKGQPTEIKGQPADLKGQPTDLNHLTNHLKEPSEDRFSPPTDLFKPDAPVETSTASKKIIGEAFARFWTVYPRRVAKGAARNAFAKAIKGGADPEATIEGARRYGAERAGEDAKFTAHPATWLRAERWLDEPAPRTGGPPTIDEAGNVIAEQPHRPAHAAGKRSYAGMIYGGGDQ